MGLGLRGVRGSGAAEAVGVTEAPLAGGPAGETRPIQMLASIPRRRRGTRRTLRGAVEAFDERFNCGGRLRGGGGPPAQAHSLPEGGQVSLHRVHVVIHSASLFILSAEHTHTVIPSGCKLTAPDRGVQTNSVYILRGRDIYGETGTESGSAEALYQLWDSSEIN